MLSVNFSHSKQCQINEQFYFVLPRFTALSFRPTLSDRSFELNFLDLHPCNIFSAVFSFNGFRTLAYRNVLYAVSVRRFKIKDDSFRPSVVKIVPQKRLTR